MKQPLPFAFYESLEEQNRFKSQCEGYSSNELLIQDGNIMLPFQIRGDVFIAPYSKGDIVFTIVNKVTGAETDITASIDVANDVDVIEDADSNSYITYFGIEPITPFTFDNCDYYLVVSDDSGSNLFTWYSEVFRVAKDDEEFVKLTWYNSTDLPSRVLYQDSYFNTAYLDVDIKKPEYPVTEDGNENGDRQFIASFIKWQKRYSFFTRLPEFLVDAITALPLHDNVNLTFKNGDIEKIIDIAVEVDWLDLGNTDKTTGCFANVTVSFAVDDIVVTPCDDNMTINVVS